MTKTELAAIEIARIVTFEYEALTNYLLPRGFYASIEHNDDDTYYLYVERWGVFKIVEYDDGEGTREHAAAALRSLAARLNLRVIGGIE